MATDAQRRAKAKYRRERMRMVQVGFSPAEEDLYEWVRSKRNMSGYIKGLIREDMEGGHRSEKPEERTPVERFIEGYGGWDVAREFARSCGADSFDTVEAWREAFDYYLTGLDYGE